MGGRSADDQPDTGFYRTRLAVAADLRPLDRLIRKSFRHLSHGHYDERQIDAALRGGLVGVTPELIGDGTYFVAVAHATVIGCGGWTRRRRFSNGAEAGRGGSCGSARLRAFFVHPDWTRRGVATALFERCLAAARAAGVRRLELLATLPGVPLYRSLGFRVVGIAEASTMPEISIPGIRMNREIQ